MKTQTIENILISQITYKNDFDINFPYSAESLEESIRNKGVITPLLAYKSEQKYVLIDGFQRFRIAKQLHIESLPLNIIKLADDFEEMLLLRYNLLISVNDDLNVLQKAHFFKLIKTHFGATKSMAKWLQLLKIPKDHQIAKILSWSQNTFRYLIKYNVSYNQIKLFFDFNNDDIEILFNLASRLSMRPVEFIKLGEILNECALNEQSSIKNILEDDLYKQILTNDEINRNQKINQLKDAVYKRRFPVISDYRQRMESLNKQFNSSGFTVNYDKNFERSGLQLNSLIKNEDDIKKLQEALNNSVNIATLIKMLKLI
jgi:hypothetical protein